jgi:hypothetical protein
MDRDAFRRASVRYGVLFLTSVLLVAGFWFHGTFYALGLGPLLLVGGFATFTILLVLRITWTGGAWRRSGGDLAFRPEQGERLKARAASLNILPMGARVPAVGAVANAVVPGSDRPAARVVVEDVQRSLYADVGEAEARAAGYDSAEDFRRRWEAEHARDPREIVLFVHFRVEDSR